MKKKLLFIVPAALLIGFLAIKPPAIGKEKGAVIVTPQTTITPSAKPNLRDFDHEGREPEHFNDHFDDDDDRPRIMQKPSHNDGKPVIQREDDDEREHENEHEEDDDQRIDVK